MAEPNGDPNKQDPKTPGGGPPGPKVSRTLVSWMLLLGLALLLVTLVNNAVGTENEIRIDQFREFTDRQVIKDIMLTDAGVITGHFTEPQDNGKGNLIEGFAVEFPPQAIDGDFIADLKEKLPAAEIEYTKQSQLLILLASMLPWLLILGFIWFVIFRQLRSAGGTAGMLGNFGRSRHRVTVKEQTNITLADVAGIEEAKEEVQEIIEFLRAPKKFQRLGARIPRGVLLVGAPGCGKTLLAKAIAGEADVPFFSISGSDFVEMFVGVGASRVRDLFKQAKENSPCIIFLDEIDAVGRRRSANFAGGGHDEREQTLNAILVEMDGFDTHSQVIVVAATNRVDILDPALTRPGRFDREVNVPMPDVQGRYEILKVHAKKVKLGPTVDLRRIARGTPMFSGAELSALVNESALIATMANKEFVEQDDLEEARDKIRWGRAMKSRKVDEQDRKLTAYHEAGHALIQALEPHADPLHKVSIIPRGPAMGATFSLPERDRMTYTRNYLVATMRVLFGGRIAEELFFNEICSGAAMDIRQLTDIVRRMITEWGMSESVGFVYYGSEDNRGMLDLGGREYSEKTAEMIDAEVRRMVEESYKQARQIITDNKDKVEAIAKALLEYETITGEEVNALIRGESLSRSVVGDLIDAAGAGKPSIGKARPVSNDSKPKPDIDGGALPQPG